MIEEELANRISYQIWYKRRLKGKFGGGVEIRCDTRKGVIDGSGHFSQEANSENVLTFHFLKKL